LFTTPAIEPGALVDLDPADVARRCCHCLWRFSRRAAGYKVECYKKGQGAILPGFASVSAQSAPFAMGKFALRGLRKVWRGTCPKTSRRPLVIRWCNSPPGQMNSPDNSDSFLDPDATPRPICMCCVVIGALGRGKLNYDLGLSGSKEANYWRDRPTSHPKVTVTTTFAHRGNLRVIYQFKC